MYQSLAAVFAWVNIWSSGNSVVHMNKVTLY